jgi:hypothetical protein
VSTLIDSSIHSSIDSLIHPLIHSLIHSLAIVCSFATICLGVRSSSPTDLLFSSYSWCCDSTETVLYLNLRVGRESMNHQVLSGDLNDALSSSPSQPSASSTDDSAFSHDSTSYRHVPLMDGEDDAEAGLAAAPPPIA